MINLKRRGFLAGFLGLLGIGLGCKAKPSLHSGQKKGLGPVVIRPVSDYPSSPADKNSDDIHFHGSYTRKDDCTFPPHISIEEILGERGILHDKKAVCGVHGEDDCRPRWGCGGEAGRETDCQSSGMSEPLGSELHPEHLRRAFITDESG